MSTESLIDAARAGDLGTARSLVARGADVNQPDEQGWTALNWAAGRGDAEMVELLVRHGADASAAGRDGRTPLMIAKAASRHAVVPLLVEAEKRAGAWSDPRRSRPYCRAYYLAEMRRFPGWSEARLNWQEPGDDEDGPGAPLGDDEIVYLHQDLTVTRSMWHDESLIYAQPTREWQEFCERALGFEIPEDLL